MALAPAGTGPASAALGPAAAGTAHPSTSAQPPSSGPGNGTASDATAGASLTANEFRVADVPPGRMKLLSLNGTDVTVYNVQGVFYATDDACTHADGPLHEGELRDNIVVCPWHSFVLRRDQRRCHLPAGYCAAANVQGAGGRDIWAGSSAPLVIFSGPQMGVTAAAVHLLHLMGIRPIFVSWFPASTHGPRRAGHVSCSLSIQAVPSGIGLDDLDVWRYRDKVGTGRWQDQGKRRSGWQKLQLVSSKSMPTAVAAELAQMNVDGLKWRVDEGGDRAMGVVPIAVAPANTAGTSTGSGAPAVAAPSSPVMPTASMTATRKRICDRRASGAQR